MSTTTETVLRDVDVTAPAYVRLGPSGPLGQVSLRVRACVMDLDGDEVRYPVRAVLPLGGGGLRYQMWARVLGPWLFRCDVGYA